MSCGTKIDGRYGTFSERDEIVRHSTVKEMLFDEIVSLINQPCDSHVNRIIEIQTLISSVECPECHAKQFLVFGSRGECQYCDVRLTIKPGDGD